MRLHSISIPYAPFRQMGCVAFACLTQSARTYRCFLPRRGDRDYPSTSVLGVKKTTSPISPIGTTDMAGTGSVVPMGLIDDGRTANPVMNRWATIIVCLRDNCPQKPVFCDGEELRLGIRGLIEQSEGTPGDFACTLLRPRHPDGWVPSLNRNIGTKTRSRPVFFRVLTTLTRPISRAFPQLGQTNRQVARAR